MLITYEKKPRRKSSEILLPIFYFWVGSNFFFPNMESGHGGIFWPKRTDGDHLEHPEKVVFMPERGRKRVKEWRDATFMKE